MRLNGWEFVIILAIVLLIFGAAKLPGLAKSLAQSLKIFRSEMKSDSKSDDSTDKPAK